MFFYSLLSFTKFFMQLGNTVISKPVVVFLDMPEIDIWFLSCANSDWQFSGSGHHIFNGLAQNSV